MPYKSDAENSPRDSRELYRGANLEDISDPKILGFYTSSGEYFRKNGVVRYYGAFSVVDMLATSPVGRTITPWNCKCYSVRLDEILSERDAPPKHFKLTRITVDVGNHEGLQRFGYLLGARGDLQEAHVSSEDSDYEITLWFLEPILMPPTRLLNLLDDCIAAQKGWGEE